MSLRPHMLLAIGVMHVAPAAICAHPGVHEEIERLDELIAAHPERADLHIARAGMWRIAGHHDAALEDLAAAEQQSPQDALIHLHRGLTLAEMGRDSDADAALSSYLDGGAGNALALAERGRVRERLGRNEDALADYAAAIAIQPDVQLVLMRGELLEKLDRLDEAAACYRDGIDKLDGAATIRHALVRAEIAREQYDSALAVIDEGLVRIDADLAAHPAALAASPARTPWLMRRADVLDLASRSAEAHEARRAALAEVDRVLTRRPNPIHLVTRAEICAALGQLEEAKRTVAEALTKAPHYRAAQELQANLITRSNSD